MKFLLVAFLGILALAVCQPVDEAAAPATADEVALEKLSDSEDLLPSEFTFKLIKKIFAKLFKKCDKKGGCNRFGYGGYGHGGYGHGGYGHGGYGHGGYGGYGHYDHDDYYDDHDYGHHYGFGFGR